MNNIVPSLFLFIIILVVILSLLTISRFVDNTSNPIVMVYEIQDTTKSGLNLANSAPGFAVYYNEDFRRNMSTCSYFTIDNSSPIQLIKYHNFAWFKKDVVTYDGKIKDIKPYTKYIFSFYFDNTPKAGPSKVEQAITPAVSPVIQDSINRSPTIVNESF